ncbi:MAG: tRNA (adenosine(37)-N6)-threonylcarbamoyltransferase complex dimerization subunit type 1 TsaB [Bacteroidales bacterium]|nr:tRNA (adenosine(37)-N6)-threonylcarbamoyltransferase complex dimerization subunit type 1 TsaB [Bacteroidales bacterium]
MSRLIFIETSTSLCSAALSENDRIVTVRRSSEPRAHASLTAVFVKEMLDEAGWTVRDLDAVCVSKGPGSYTGLRVGVSTAKGLCFGGGVPLISVDTLEILTHQAIEAGLPEGCKAILPMVDARRMEVYTAPYSPTGERLGDIAPVVLDSNSFADLFASGPVVVIGDAAEKFANLLGQGVSTQQFVQCCPEATAMLVPAMAKFAKKEFEDVAYFEPFYLKQFIATTPKKLF